MDKVRVAVIGVGGMGLNHVKAIKSIEQAELVAVADVNEETAKKVAEEYGAKCYTDYKEMLAKEDLDAVTIATPHPLHAEVGIYVMDAGKHVFTEKPIAATVSQADAMIEASKRNNVTLAVMYQQRTTPINQEVKRMIAEGEIGELVRVNMVSARVRTQAYYNSGAWRGTWKWEGGGVLLNQAPHEIDRLQWLVGMPVRIWGRIKTRMHEIEVEDTACAILEYPNGAFGVIQVSTTDAPGVTRYEICGTKGYVLLEGAKARAARFKQPLDEFISTCPDVWASPEMEWYDVTVEKKPCGHAEMIRDFVLSLIEGRPPMVDGEEGRNSLEISNAIILSSVRGKPVDLPVDRAEYDALVEELAREAEANPRKPLPRLQ